MDKINVLIVDDHPLYREGVRRIIESIEAVEHVQEAGNGVECLKVLAEQSTQVVLLDVSMPKMDGIECLRKIKQRHPKVKVIMLTQFDQVKYFTRVMDIGAEGYLLKDVNASEFVDAVYTVMEEESRAISQRVQKIFDDISSTLRPREIDVLVLMCEGRNSQEIAAELHISVNTVNNHRSNISNRIGTRNLAGLFKWAFKNNIIRVDD